MELTLKLLHRSTLTLLVILLVLIQTTSASADESPERDFSKNLDALVDQSRIKKDAKDRRERQALLDSDKDDLERKQADDQNRNSARSLLKQKWLETYQDTDFSKHSFDDLRSLSGASVFKSSPDWLKKSHDARHQDDHSGAVDDTFLKDALAQYKRKSVERDLRDKKYLDSENDDSLLHDWVPASPDPTANGSFAVGADNGSPVPYKLNGWVVIERKLPWEEQ